MPLQAIRTNVYEVGSAHAERLLYDDFMPLPHGTSYNSYLIVGREKSALLDTVPLVKFDRFCRNMEDGGFKDPDYLLMFTAQEDYAAPLPRLLKQYPKLKIVCSLDLKAQIQEQVELADDLFYVMKDSDVLDLGGYRLQYHCTAYSPDYQISSAYLEDEHILFSGSIFSSHFTDENVFSTFGREEIASAKRYFASQIMARREEASAFVEAWSQLRLSLIAPAHGPVWQDPSFIIKRYRRWLSEELNPDVVIAYVSLYEHTRSLVEKLMFGLVNKGFSVICRDVAEKPESLLHESAEVLVDLVQASTFILASSTTLQEPHPAATYLATLVNMMRPKTALYGFAGSKIGPSYTAERLGELLHLEKAERLPDLFLEGKIDDQERHKIERYVEALAEQIQQLPKLKRPVN